jgi:hypothetical protein
MPVNFRCTSSESRRGRAGTFHKVAREMVPAIVELQTNGVRGIGDIAIKLNAAGRVAPSGRPLSFSTMRRILHRLSALGLVEAPRTKSEIAKLPRTYRGYVRKATSKICW